jgi:hypothetical protein
VMRAGKIVNWQQQLLEEDRKSVALLRSVLPSLAPSGQSWAKVLMNRLEFRILYLQAVQSLNNSFMVYDQVANAQGLRAGTKAAKQETAKALQLAAQAIEKYAEVVRNRGDLGLIGQLNVQFYDVVAQLDAGFQLDSPYLTLNWTALRMVVGHRSDLTTPNCWPMRDGVADLTAFDDQGSPAIRVALAGTPNARLGSRFVRTDAIDLELQPLMDFCLRTTTQEPVAFMFQIEDKDDWFELDLVGTQGYRKTDRINETLEINDGQWHRVTWNLRKLVAERIDPNIKSIKTLILGTWANPQKPVVVEFKNVCFGSFNKLDGVDVNQSGQ